MLINLFRIHGAKYPEGHESPKLQKQKAGTMAGPGFFCWLVARIKSRFQAARFQVSM
jgi:hypothetical protein